MGGKETDSWTTEWCNSCGKGSNLGVTGGMAVWCEGGKDPCTGGTDKGEILAWQNGANAARGRAKEEPAVERQIHGR